MIADKLGKGSQKAIGQRLTVDALDKGWQCHLRLFLEKGLDIFGKQTTVKGMDKSFAENSSTTLVTKDISQGWRMLYNLSAVVETRVGSSTENTSHTFLTTTESAGGAKQIAVSLNGGCLREHLVEKL